MDRLKIDLRWLLSRAAYVMAALLLGTLTSQLLTFRGSNIAIIQDKFMFAWHAAVAIWALVLYQPMLRRVGGEDRPELPWRRRAVAHLVAGAAITGIIILVPIALALGFREATLNLRFDGEKFAWLAIFSFGIGVMEEIAFRGLLLDLATRLMPTAAAAIVVSLLFAWAHIDTHSALGLASVFAGGLMFTLAFYVTRDLWLAIGMHTGWDLALFALEQMPSIVPNQSPRGLLSIGLQGFVLIALQVFVMLAFVVVLLLRHRAAALEGAK